MCVPLGPASACVRHCCWPVAVLPATSKQTTLEEENSSSNSRSTVSRTPNCATPSPTSAISLLLLERARVKLASKPIEAEYGEDSLALLKHYPTPQALVDTYINGLFVLRKTSLPTT